MARSGAGELFWPRELKLGCYFVQPEPVFRQRAEGSSHPRRRGPLGPVIK